MNRASTKYRTGLSTRFLLLALLCAIMFMMAFASPAPASLFENRTGLFLSSEAGFAGVEGGLDAGLHRVYKTFSYNFAPGSLVASKSASNTTGFKGSKGFELKNAPYQKVRNTPTIINNRNYSGHALDQMQNRGLTPSVVDNTIQTGTKFTTKPGTTGFYDSVNNVRVITNSDTGTIVTVIRGAP